jgi:hypothetical protein
MSLRTLQIAVCRAQEANRNRADDQRLVGRGSLVLRREGQRPERARFQKIYLRKLSDLGD